MVMLPTQVMINGAFSFSAFHGAEQGAEELLARTQQVQPWLPRPHPRRWTQTRGCGKAAVAGTKGDAKGVAAVVLSCRGCGGGRFGGVYVCVSVSVCMTEGDRRMKCVLELLSGLKN